MRKRVPRFGDKVRFYFGKNPVIGQIREDRGPIGIGARHLYEIVYELGEGNVYYIELPAEEFELLDTKKDDKKA